MHNLNWENKNQCIQSHNYTVHYDVFAQPQNISLWVTPNHKFFFSFLLSSYHLVNVFCMVIKDDSNTQTKRLGCDIELNWEVCSGSPITCTSQLCPEGVRRRVKVWFEDDTLWAHHKHRDIPVLLNLQTTQPRATCPYHWCLCPDILDVCTQRQAVVLSLCLDKWWNQDCCWSSVSQWWVGRFQKEEF